MERTIKWMVAVALMMVLTATVTFAATRYGTTSPDTIYGTSSADQISGYGGGTLYGLSGNDRTSDGSSDYVDCGPGVDAVLVPPGTSQIDRLVGCEAILAR